MMQLATTEDFPEIIDIWQESFGDSKKEIMDFFHAFSGKMRICVWKENTCIAGQLILLPVWLHYATQSEKFESTKMIERIEAEYLYGVATKREYRNRGVSTKLLSAVSHMLLSENKAAVLVPADENLGAFYEKRGFRKCFSQEKIVIDACKEQEKCSVENIDATEYGLLRQRAFADGNYIELPQNMLEYAINLHKQESGFCIKISLNNKKYGVLYKLSKNDEILLQEITAKEREESIRAAKALLVALHKKQGILQRSFYTCGLHLPEGIPQEGYFNLVLN